MAIIYSGIPRYRLDETEEVLPRQSYSCRDISDAGVPTNTVCSGVGAQCTLVVPMLCHGHAEQPDMMTKRGWSLNDLQSPACIHVCVTLNVAPRALDFLEDLKASVAEVREEGSSGMKKGNAGIYGSVGHVPEGPVNHILRTFTDLTLTP